MELDETYLSSQEQVIEGEEVVQIDRETMPESLDARSVRKVYLITYSQANQTKFPTRKSFAVAVLRSFGMSTAKVLQWCCSLEKHQMSGYHYHMAVKLNKNQRWIPSKRFLSESHGISVHFSSVHSNYYSAWRYVTKADADALHSPEHPDLENTGPPRTSNASHVTQRCTKRHNTETGDGEDTTVNRSVRKAVKRKRMSAFELSEVIVEKSIRTRTELLALANKQKAEGKTDMAEFIVNRGPKMVSDILETAWEMENAPETLSRSRKSRLEILQEAKNGECTDGCDGQWLICAKEVLQNNGIVHECFQQSVLELLEKGRGKYRNLMIVGPANCAKTFILNPLNKIFNTFSNPASTSFAWVGAEKAECLFLNDFRWSPMIIQWHDFLLLLEGQLVHLPAPKSHYAKDIVFDGDTPIFATGKHAIIYVKNGSVDERETEMMAVRWKVYTFSHQISQEVQREIPPCPKCFADFVLNP